MEAPTRHKKWTRSSQSCTQTKSRSSRVTSVAAGTVALSEFAAAHGGQVQAVAQQQQYSKRSRYCLQLTSCGAGSEHAQSAYTSVHSTREGARRDAQSAPIPGAPPRASMPSVPAAYTVPAAAASANVYVRGTVHAQRQQQPTHTLQASLPRQRHAAVGARAVSAANLAGEAVLGSAVVAAATHDVISTQLQGTLLEKASPVQDPEQYQQHKAKSHMSVANVQQVPQQANQGSRISQPPQGQLQQRSEATVVRAATVQQHAQAALQQQPAVAAPVPHWQVHQALKQEGFVRQLPQQRQQGQPVIKHWLAGAGQVTTCAAAQSNVKLVYKRRRHKLERTGVRAAVAGASLSWIRESAAPHLAAAAQAAVAAAAASAAAKHAARKDRARQAHQWQQQRYYQLLQSRRQAVSTAAAAAAAPQAAAGVHKTPVKWLTRGFKLVRIGGQLYYSTPKGLCSAAAAKLMAKRTPTYSRAAQPILHRTAAASGLGVQKIIQKPRSSGSSSSSRSSKLAFQQRPVIPAAAGVAKRLLSSTAVARSLAVARGRNAAKRAAASRGICRHYCKHGKCDLALRSRCEKVHDPSKVAVCQQWLSGKCSNADCKLQHQVVPELMPVCTYFLEGMCSNRDCPYLHVKVAADASACRAFLQGYCPAGATCPHKHLTYRMMKQQQHPQQQQQQERGVGRQKKHSGAKARNRYVRQAAAEVLGNDSLSVTGKQQQASGAGTAAVGGCGRSRSVGMIESRCSVGMVLEQLLPQLEGV